MQKRMVIFLVLGGFGLRVRKDRRSRCACRDPNLGLGFKLRTAPPQ